VMSDEAADPLAAGLRITAEWYRRRHAADLA
jgi:hypothetical protein